MVEIHSGPVTFSPPVSLAPFSLLRGMGKVCLGRERISSPPVASKQPAAAFSLPFWRLPAPESQDGNGVCWMECTPSQGRVQNNSHQAPREGTWDGGVVGSGEAPP